MSIQDKLNTIEVGDRLRDNRGYPNFWKVLKKVPQGIVIGNLTGGGHLQLITRFSDWADFLEKIED
jgi:hypothetical protein